MTPIETTLAELRHALNEFIALLKRESTALEDLQPEGLATIVAEKTRWAETANSAWQKLVATSRTMAGPASSLDQTLSTQPGLVTLWTEIKILTDKAARLNQGNNVLIEAQLRRTRLALDVLTTAANRGGVYGADGQLQDSFHVPNTLDKV